IEPNSKDEILSQMRLQAELAIDMADVVILMVNVADGVTANDLDVASMLLKAKKEIVLCVNKVDSIGEPPMEFYEFYNLGLGDPIAVSSTHGLGLGDLLDEVCRHFPENADLSENDDEIKVAVIGRPNAGKSSLINRILGENRVIVSGIAGTTRDAIDSHFENNGDKYLFIDTAGMRKRKKIDENIEHYSVVRALAAVDRSDVCVIMLDANEGVTEQDTKIAGYAHEKGKACILAVNKWDSVAKDSKTMKGFTLRVQEGFAFMSYAPVMFISAKTGQRVDKLLEEIKLVNEQHKRRITTGMLNDVLNDAMSKQQPPSDKGKRLKIYYGTQASAEPPTFVLFCNSKDLFHYSYLRFIENQIRAAFGFDGTPIRFILREKGQKDQ
ncbi:MAG: ribosome biogenesis GTPase Der, partial [Clostridiales bacterium]|nr:ribosome biogenesis GTPase Der [Clostridiales bacterium]